MKILVIYGGDGLSQEAEVSHRSGKSVLTMLETAGYTADGFVINSDNIAELDNTLPNYDLVLPILHGTFGEDGQIQKILETHGVKYLGSDSVASALCFDKALCKQKLTENYILVPSGIIAKSVDDIRNIKLPAFAKPNHQGSGLGIIKINQLDSDTVDEINRAIKDFGELLVEEFIDGTEISVGILGERPLPVAEIIPPNQELFTYENRYSGKSEEVVPSINVTPELQARAQGIALAAHQACNCHDWSRTDMIIRGSDIFVLEINTTPGMTEASLYPKMLVASGLSIKDLIDQALSR